MNDYKRYAVALALVGAFVWSGSESTRAATYDWCYNSCGEGQGCNKECEADGGGTITCADYDGGPANGWCDGNTCEDFCGVWVPAGQECWHENVLTDCYGYGDYAQCGDGVCSKYGNNEDCATCPDDCGGSCPPIVCGDTDCSDMESYRNCPADCDPPNPSTAYCGDGTCDTDEELTCGEDCDVPGEFCDGWDYFCPLFWQCVGNLCIREEYIGMVQQCPDGTGCESGTVCTQATDMYQQPVKICVPWWYLQ